jgi:hypothetical protein
MFNEKVELRAPLKQALATVAESWRLRVMVISLGREEPKRLFLLASNCAIRQSGMKY